MNRLYSHYQSGVEMMNNNYRLLLLTSVPDSTEEVTAVAEKHFLSPTVIFWEMGNTSTKPDVLARIEARSYCQMWCLNG